MVTRCGMKTAAGIAVLAMAGASHAAIRFGQRSAAPVPAPQAIINPYCIGCHSKDSTVVQFPLDTAGISDPAAHPEVWEKVIKKLRARMMPPPNRPRPDESAYNELIS